MSNIPATIIERMKSFDSNSKLLAEILEEFKLLPETTEKINNIIQVDFHKQAKMLVEDFLESTGLGDEYVIRKKTGPEQARETITAYKIEFLPQDAVKLVMFLTHPLAMTAKEIASRLPNYIYNTIYSSIIALVKKSVLAEVEQINHGKAYQIMPYKLKMLEKEFEGFCPGCEKSEVTKSNIARLVPKKFTNIGTSISATNEDYPGTSTKKRTYKKGIHDIVIKTFKEMQKELSAKEIREICDIKYSTASNMLAVLVRDGILRERVDGKRKFYTFLGT